MTVLNVLSVVLVLAAVLVLVASGLLGDDDDGDNRIA